MTRNIKLVQAAASFALTGTGGSCSSVEDLVSVLKGLSIVLRVGVPGLDLILGGTWFTASTPRLGGPDPYVTYGTLAASLLLWQHFGRTSENSVKAKFAEFYFYDVRE